MATAESLLIVPTIAASLASSGRPGLRAAWLQITNGPSITGGTQLCLFHGHEYSRYYHGYEYRGRHFDVYAPSYYYRPAFYGWAYKPVGKADSLWLGLGRRSLVRVLRRLLCAISDIPSAAFWLTDYLISQDLQAAYTAHQEAGEAAPIAAEDGGGPMLTPDVKQQIAEEVRGQLALENRSSRQNAQQQDTDPGSSGIGACCLDGHKHVFVVGSALDVTDSNQAECALSDGDVLGLMSPPPPDAAAADLVVTGQQGWQ